jgi:hypothetical protein
MGRERWPHGGSQPEAEPARGSGEFRANGTVSHGGEQMTVPGPPRGDNDRHDALPLHPRDEPNEGPPLRWVVQVDPQDVNSELNREWPPGRHSVPEPDRNPDRLIFSVEEDRLGTGEGHQLGQPKPQAHVRTGGAGSPTGQIRDVTGPAHG